MTIDTVSFERICICGSTGRIPFRLTRGGLDTGLQSSSMTVHVLSVVGFSILVYGFACSKSSDQANLFNAVLLPAMGIVCVCGALCKLYRLLQDFLQYFRVKKGVLTACLVLSH